MTRPIARPIASIDRSRKSRTGPSFRQTTAAKDSLTARPSRISARRLDYLSSQITDQDRGILSFVSGVRLATGHQLLRHFWMTGSDQRSSAARAGRRALKRLTDWRVLDVLPRSVGGLRRGSSGLIYCVGPAGARLLARGGSYGRRLPTPGDRYIAHTLSLTEVVVALHEADRDGELELIRIQTEPRSWRGYIGVMGARQTVKPDMFVRVGAGALEDRWFLEQDRSTEAPATVLAKAKRYFDYYRSGTEQNQFGAFPKVLWAVPDKRRVEQVETVLAHLPGEARRLFVVCLHSEMVERLAMEART